MPAVTVEVLLENIDQLILHYETGDEVADNLLMEGMERSVNYGVLNAAMAPEETSANQPPPPYYIRDVGTQYKSSNRLESQHMSREESWNKEISKEDNGVIGTIEPTPAYAPYLHGMTSQLARHALNRWRKVDAIAEDITEHIQDIFAEQTAKLVAYLRGK